MELTHAQTDREGEKETSCGSLLVKLLSFFLEFVWRSSLKFHTDYKVHWIESFQYLHSGLLSLRYFC